MSPTTEPLTQTERSQYDEYEDTGVDWIGEIPAHWENARLKFVAQLETGHTPSRSEDEYWEDLTIPWVTLSDVGKLRSGKVDHIYETKEKISELGLENSSARLLPEGTVILSRTASVGFAAILGKPMATTQDFVNWVCGDKLEPKYLLHCFRNMRQEFERITDGSTHKTIYMPEVERFRIPLPPLDEQRTIAAYLDRETERIDTLIEKKERLIDLLEEERTALISRVVTKGLDEDVEMQDSGVEWLGEIPAGWEIIKLRWLTESIEQGWSPNAEEREAAEDEWGVITLSAVKNGRFYPKEHKTLPKDTEPKPNYEIQSGDFLLTRANTPELVGDVCLVRETRDKLMMSDLVYRLALRQDLVDGRFLMYWMNSRNGRHQVERSARGSSKSMVKVSQGHIKSWIAALPSPDEQRRIADHLDEKTAQLDSLIERIEEAIDRLTEYRTALISAAVTGQIDVRGERETDEVKEVDTWARMNLVMELIRRMRTARHQSFGRTMLVKMLYLIQHHVRVKGLQFNYKRKDFGPYPSELRYEVENNLQNQGWLNVSERGDQVQYDLREKADDETVQGYFEGSWGDVKDQIDEIVSLFHRFENADQAEIVATLYAAWNDLLILDRPHSEDDIIREVLHNWHPRKQTIDEDRWRDALRWMKDEGLVPSGFGDPTIEDED